MPSHIDVRRGRWAQSIVTNHKALASDRRYRKQSPQQDVYNIYMAHNQHMLAYSAMMCGQSKLAIGAINEMAKGIPPEWLKDNAALADEFTAMPLEVLVRFGRWDEVLAAPEPPDYLPIARPLRHCSGGISYAAKGDVKQAKEDQAAFLAAKKKRFSREKPTLIGRGLPVSTHQKKFSQGRSDWTLKWWIPSIASTLVQRGVISVMPCTMSMGFPR